MKRHGFTLLELLVVSAIALILAAIFMSIITPGHRSGESKNRTACQQQLRQIGLSTIMYVLDNADRYPPVRGKSLYYGWADALVPYLKKHDYFQCPSDPTPLGKGDGPVTPTYTDYFFNSCLGGRNQQKFKYAATTIAIGESVPGDAQKHSNGGTGPKGGVAQLVDTAGTPIGAAMRHLNGANYVFADGHVKWLKGKDANATPGIRNAASGATGTYPSFAFK